MRYDEGDASTRRGVGRARRGLAGARPGVAYGRGASSDPGERVGGRTALGVEAGRTRTWHVHSRAGKTCTSGLGRARPGRGESLAHNGVHGSQFRHQARHDRASRRLPVPERQRPPPTNVTAELIHDRRAGGQTGVRDLLPIAYSEGTSCPSRDKRTRQYNAAGGRSSGSHAPIWASSPPADGVLARGAYNLTGGSTGVVEGARSLDSPFRCRRRCPPPTCPRTSAL